jgi:single-strand DNA-binding protein
VEAVTDVDESQRGAVLVNTVTLVGHLDTDPASRIVGKQSVVRIRLVLDDRAERASVTVDVDVWGNQGAAVERYLSRGRLVGVVGRLASSMWRDGISNRRQHVFVIAQTVDFLDKPARAQNNRD